MEDFVVAQPSTALFEDGHGWWSQVLQAVVAIIQVNGLHV